MEILVFIFFHHIGNPKELTARFGAYYVLTVACELRGEEQVSAVVTSFAPSARITYSLAGTIKFELPISEVSFFFPPSLSRPRSCSCSRSCSRSLARALPPCLPASLPPSLPPFRSLFLRVRVCVDVRYCRGCKVSLFPHSNVSLFPHFSVVDTL
jgi:hypothetical protein